MSLISGENDGEKKQKGKIAKKSHTEMNNPPAARGQMKSKNPIEAVHQFWRKKK